MIFILKHRSIVNGVTFQRSTRDFKFLLIAQPPRQNCHLQNVYVLLWFILLGYKGPIWIYKFKTYLVLGGPAGCRHQKVISGYH